MQIGSIDFFEIVFKKKTGAEPTSVGFAPAVTKGWKSDLGQVG